MLVDEQVAPDRSAVTWIAPDIEKGRTYQVVTGVPGKTGIVYTLDRKTGKFLWARPTVKQNVVHAIDGATGKVTLEPASVPREFGTPHEICPSTSGGANYMAGAYSPLAQSMFFPLQNLCAQMSALKPGPDAGVYAFTSHAFITREANGQLGTIHAVDAVTGRTRWVYKQRAGMQSLLTTGGGLVFAGDAVGRFMALDQDTGKVLWQVNLGSSVTGYPVTFTVDGQQYVAVSTGRWLSDTFTPELLHGTQNTLFVFALPQAGIGYRGPSANASIQAARRPPPIPRPGRPAWRPARQATRHRPTSRQRGTTSTSASAAPATDPTSSRRPAFP